MFGSVVVEEIVKQIGSVVVEEIVKQILSAALSDNAHEERWDEAEHAERLEMAQIRLGAVLEASVGWQIKDSSLLRWRRKLKRVAQECDEALHRCKQRIVEDEEKERAASESSFPRRLALATKARLSSVIGAHRRDDDPRRFEWFADGAAEFLRFVELGGTLRRYLFFEPLIGKLLAGKELRYRRLVRGRQHHVVCMRPVSFEGRGLEANLMYVHEDDDAPENNFCLGLMLRLSDSIDVVGVAIKCLQQLLITPHFKSTAEVAMREIAQLPTQDFSWVEAACTQTAGHREHWDIIHTILARVARPNPNCCKHHHHEPNKPSCSGSSNMHAAANKQLPLPHVSLEPVIEIYLLRIIPVSLSSQRSAPRRKLVHGGGPSKELSTHLKLGIIYSPHGGVPEDMVLPSIGSSIVEYMDGKERHYVMHNNNTSLLERLDEIMLPKAIDCLYRNPERVMHLSWKSKHEAAYLRLEKTTEMARVTWDGIGDDPSRDLSRTMVHRRHDPKLETWIEVFADFIRPWIALAPKRLQRPLSALIKEADENNCGVAYLRLH